MNAVAQVLDCEHCRDARIVMHAQLGPIRCPQCTVRAKPRDPKEMDRQWREFNARIRKELSASEVRRVARAIDRLTIAAVLDNVKFPGTPRHLVVTDGILQRWAAAPTGVPAENPDLYRESRPPPLDPKTQEAVSDIVKLAPCGIRAFVVDWYKRMHMSMAQMGEDRHMTRRQLGIERENVLVYMRARFLASAHADLVRLARMAP